MIRAALGRWWARPVGRVALATTALAVPLLLGSDAYVFTHSAWALMVACAALAFAVRRRWLDAIAYLAAFAAAQGVEAWVGPQVLACVVLPLLAATRRPRFALALGGGLFALFVAVMALKDRFAGSPLLWQDVHFFFLRFRANASVIWSQPTLSAYAVAAAVALGALVVLAWRIDRPGPDARVARASVVLAAAAVLVAWSGMGIQDRVGAVARRAANVIGAEWAGRVWPISRFIATISMQPQLAIAPVDTAPFAAAARSRMGGGAAQPADMVLILQESQFNPLDLPGCPPQLCAMPVFAQGPQTVAFGPLNVHVVGSGTWLSEFSVATGVPHTVFGPAARFASFNVAPGVRRAMPQALRDAGYHTVAVYPVSGGFMNARNAYAAYGYDAFYDHTDLRLTGAFDTSDEAVHAAARKVLERERERAQGKPVFLMVVTIFNHGEHGVHLERVPQALRQAVTRHFPDEREAQNMADYLWRTQQFQESMARTTQAVLQGPRPAVVAWFGDHQPTFGSAPAMRDRLARMASRYRTWYHLASNIPRIDGRTTKPGETDIVFLPGLLAQAAGVPLDPWLAANVAAREGCKGSFTACPQATRDAYLTHLMRDLGAMTLD